MNKIYISNWGLLRWKILFYRGSENPEEFQEQTCKLLANTVDDCGKIWELCYTPTEVRNIKDMHIQARIGQFQDNSDGIDVNECIIVKEYQESGRADNMKQTIRHSIY